MRLTNTLIAECKQHHLQIANQCKMGIYRAVLVGVANQVSDITPFEADSLEGADPCVDNAEAATGLVSKQMRFGHVIKWLVRVTLVADRD